MEAIKSIVVDWLSNKLTTNEAADLILKRLACSSMGMLAIMKCVNELPEELIMAMNER